MSPLKKYADAQIFRRALETRLNNLAKTENIDLDRLRKQVAFDRLLARIFADPEKAPWRLKGGYAMELRFLGLARATKDIDLSMPKPMNTVGGAGTLETIRGALQDSASMDSSDWFQYLIKAPVMELDAAPYGGARFPVEARLAGTKFANFHLDVGVGDVLLFSPEWKHDHDLLRFAGIPSARIPLISREQQFAEKIHTYTLPREGTPNSRTRDLIDLVILIEAGLDDKNKIRTALVETFKRRKTHEVPNALEAPSVEWAGPYAALARDCGVSQKDLVEAFGFLKTFWESLY